MDLDNKSVVIVGASSGLGKALAKLLSKEGTNLFLISRKVALSNIPSAIKIAADVRKAENIKIAFEEIDKHTGSIDLLINCAGIGLLKDLRESTIEEINDVIDTDLKGAIYVAQEVYKRMAEKGSGHIINIVSTSGLRARPMETVYCAAKWGLRGFTESLQVAGEETGVKVTGVYPGGMKSENFWKITPGKDISGFMDQNEVAQKIIDLIKGDYQKEVTIERPKK
ncbi:MAG: SDR family oxidoreductase [Candidatus Levybacteria bacterium]|nr:SDR family oxidoreductase [Candidatus Levybacteria bacterium]